MPEKNLKKDIEMFFSEQIRPTIQLDGGDIHLLDVIKRKDDSVIVKVTLAGACVGCGLSGITLQMGVETRLKQRFPEVSKIEVV